MLQVETFHDSLHQYAKKLHVVQDWRPGGDGTRSSLIRMLAELCSTMASWNALGEESMCLNLCSLEWEGWAAAEPSTEVISSIGSHTGFAEVVYGVLCLGGTCRQLLLICPAPFPYNIKHNTFQILIVPVTDNTVTTETSPTYRSYEHTAALPAEKMMWYRRHCLPNETNWPSIGASPLLASADTFARLPPDLVVVAGLDVLRWEGEEYARRLRQAGVNSEVQVMDGVPRPFIVMDAVLQKGRDGVNLVCNRLAAALR
jgi:hypothetical protein